MKRTLVTALLAIVAVAIFSFGCKKEENVNTDTAAVDTGVTSSGPSTTDTTATSANTTMSTAPAMTDTTGTAASTTTGIGGATGTTGATRTY